MTLIHRQLMMTLYGHDIWEAYEPTAAPNGVVDGWNGNHPSLRHLAETGEENKVVIDIGVWKGQSTITLANALRESEINGCVLAVDTFLGSPEHWGEAYFERRHGMPSLYNIFLDNVFHAGLTDYVIPVPQTSSTAVAVFRARGIDASLIHVDAAHEYEDVLRDVSNYWSVLRSGGTMVGDDYHETWPGVIRAAGEFSARTGRPLSIDPPKWIMQKA